MSKFAQVILIAWRCLMQQKLRSVLSILGVVCAVAAVLTMIAVGQGAKQKILTAIERLGTRHIYLKSIDLTPDQSLAAHSRHAGGLTLADTRRIRIGCPDVKAVAALKDVTAAVLGTGKSTPPQITAISPGYATLQHLVIARGRFLSDLDTDRRSLVCVTGSRVARNLGITGDRSALVRIQDQPFNVVGVLQKIDTHAPAVPAISSRNYNNMLFIPLGTEGVLVTAAPKGGRTSPQRLNEIVVQIGESDHVLRSARVIRRIMTVAHHGARDYRIIVPLELLNQAAETQRTFNRFLAAVAGIALLVGSIGIMNIMLATVSERTREIGVRRTVGATRGDIAVQFLTEAVMLTGCGGVIGSLIGVVSAQAVAAVTGWQTRITPWAIVIPLGMSLLAGVFAGIYPACRAAYMDPATALRKL